MEEPEDDAENAFEEPGEEHPEEGEEPCDHFPDGQFPEFLKLFFSYS